jgi:ABC-type cobalamin/Fe3+-siderophores transport system ATPase subunit
MPVIVREVVLMGRYGALGFFKPPGKHDQEVVDEVLELVGMNHLAQRPIGHLSGGEQQRVAIARCLAQEPEIMLLDEPTASLDWKAKNDILQLVKLVHLERRLTTLFVTHDLEALPEHCSQVVLLKDGLIWGQGLPDEILTNNNLSQLYNIPVEEVQKRRLEVIAA